MQYAVTAAFLLAVAATHNAIMTFALARILPKLGGTSGPAGAEGGDVAPGARRITAPAGKPRARRGRA
jgi:hypothetical protein